MFLELRDYYVNPVRLHVTAAGTLVRRGVDRTTSDNRRYARLARGGEGRTDLVIRRVRERLAAGRQRQFFR